MILKPFYSKLMEVFIPHEFHKKTIIEKVVYLENFRIKINSIQ